MRYLYCLQVTCVLYMNYCETAIIKCSEYDMILFGYGIVYRAQVNMIWLVLMQKD